MQKFSCFPQPSLKSFLTTSKPVRSSKTPCPSFLLVIEIRGRSPLLPSVRCPSVVQFGLTKPRMRDRGRDWMDAAGRTDGRTDRLDLFSLSLPFLTYWRFACSQFWRTHANRAQTRDTNNFLHDQQLLAPKSMWVKLLRFKYKDYALVKDHQHVLTFS